MGKKGKKNVRIQDKIAQLVKFWETSATYFKWWNWFCVQDTLTKALFPTHLTFNEDHTACLCGASELKTHSFGIIRASWGDGECTWPFRKCSYCWLFFSTRLIESPVQLWQSAQHVAGWVVSKREKQPHHVDDVYWPCVLNDSSFREATDSFMRYNFPIVETALLDTWAEFIRKGTRALWPNPVCVLK